MDGLLRDLSRKVGIVGVLDITFYYAILLHSPQALSSIFVWFQENNAEHKREKSN